MVGVQYHSINRLELCDSTMLLGFALFNQLDDPSTHVNIPACTADLQSVVDTASTGTTATCQRDDVSQTQMTASLQLASSGSSSSAQLANVVAALDQLRTYSALSEAHTGCNETINFAYSGNTTVGVYVGSGLANQGHHQLCPGETQHPRPKRRCHCGEHLCSAV